MNSYPQPSPTHAGRRDGLPVRRLLLGLALLTLVAITEKVLGLSAPMPKIEAPSSLRLGGYRISALPIAAPQRGRDLSLGTMRQFRLVPDSGEPQLTVTLLPVSSRAGTKSGELTLGGMDLSIEAVGSEVTVFALKDQRIVSLTVANAVGSATRIDQLALGRGPADPAGSTSRLQACITRSGMAAVTATTLAREPVAIGKPGEPAPLQRRIQRILGLQPSRHECLVVQLESSASAGGKGSKGSLDRQRQLETVWKDLRRVLVRL